MNAVIGLLDQLDLWIDEIPPLSTPQRFGNLAFRTWGKRLEDVSLRISIEAQIVTQLGWHSARTVSCLRYFPRNSTPQSRISNRIS